MRVARPTNTLLSPPHPVRVIRRAPHARRIRAANGDAAAVLVTITPLLAIYGSTEWSWLFGPLSALALWALGHGEREDADAPAP